MVHAFWRARPAPWNIQEGSIQETKGRVPQGGGVCRGGPVGGKSGCVGRSHSRRGVVQWESQSKVVSNGLENLLDFLSGAEGMNGFVFLLVI